jgi:PA14 domain
VTADDGARLYVDGVRVIDKWIDQPPTTYRVTLPLDGGVHTVEMEYYENWAGAVARLTYGQVAEAAPPAGYHAEYWNTPDASGAPSMPARAPDLERPDATLDFDWGEGSPGNAITPDRFVARWTRTVQLSAGLYRFTVGRDDGMRVYLDNVPVLDRWTFGNADDSVEKVVAGGTHELRVEYFEGGGGARASLSYDRIGDVVSSDGGFATQYYANRDLAGDPALTRTDDAVDFNWGEGAPGDGVPANNFSARWTKSVTVDQDASYRFTVTADDGIRLYVDGQSVLDKWILQGATAYTVTQYLTQGTHQVVLEYFEANGDAVAKLALERTDEPPPPPPDPFSAEYFDNSTLSGSPVLTRSDDAIDFDWCEGTPGPLVPSDRFSARWTRTTSYAAGTYRFAVTGDDGIRVLVDGVVVVDGWNYQSPTTYTADVALPEGEHTVVVEYFEWTGGAVAKFSELPVGHGGS